MPATGPEVYSITRARRSLSAEQSSRTRRYLVSMGVRTACVVAAILVPGWPRWILIAAAVLLPYFAVVMANAGRENHDPPHVEMPTLMTPLELPSAETGSSARSGA